MKLSNPFPSKVRWLFFDSRYSCFVCGRNDTELHHIAGRVSDSAFNASVLCKKCHAKVNHSESEEIMLFSKTFAWLLKTKYSFTENDLEFANSNKRLETAIRTFDADKYLRMLNI